MKVKIGKYIDWVGPYQIAEKILFWIPKYDENYSYSKSYDKYVHGLGEWLADTPVNDICQWIHSKRKRTVVIKTDPWDHWNARETMAMMCLPVLKDLQTRKQGYPWTAHEDGPWYYRFVNSEDEYGWSEQGSYCHERWEWILDEIIWSLEQVIDEDWEFRYHHGESDILWGEPDETGAVEMLKGPKDTRWWDKEGHMKHQERINRGLILLGTYWQNMWD